MYYFEQSKVYNRLYEDIKEKEKKKLSPKIKEHVKNSNISPILKFIYLYLN